MKKALVSLLLVPMFFACFFLNINAEARPQEIDIKEVYSYLGKNEKYIKAMKDKPDQIKTNEQAYYWLYHAGLLRSFSETIVFDSKTRFVNQYIAQVMCASPRTTLEQFTYFIDYIDRFSDAEKIVATIDYNNIGSNKEWAAAVWEVEDTNKRISIIASELYVYVFIFYSEES